MTIRTCLNPACSQPFEVTHRPGGRYQKYCSTACRVKMSHARYEQRKAEAHQDEPEDAEPRRAGRPPTCKGESVRFFHAPVIDGDDWPKGCAFSLDELRDTLHLGYFPNGAKFRTKDHKTYTVRGKEAVAVDGERIA